MVSEGHGRAACGIGDYTVTLPCQGFVPATGGGEGNDRLVHGDGLAGGTLRAQSGAGDDSFRIDGAAGRLVMMDFAGGDTRPLHEVAGISGRVSLADLHGPGTLADIDAAVPEADPGRRLRKPVNGNTVVLPEDRRAVFRDLRADDSGLDATLLTGRTLDRDG